MNGEQQQSSSNLVGSVLLGRYRIVRELAKGGMGVVYLARAEGAVGFVKPYVIKLVLPEHADNQRFIQMFVREANILSNLRHPGIASVIELGEREDDGALVMVLEYVRGYHLGQWAKFIRLKQRKIPVELLLQLTIDVLEALHYAHTMTHPDGTPMYIVHRDISPSNILLDEDGRARLLDFGVARMRGGNQDYHTQVKGFVGKLMYSAPELFGEVEATAQSDCYSCAVVLHEILLGRNAFRGETQAATLNRVLHHKPELIEPLRPDVPKGIDAVLQKGLAKAPKDRQINAREFAAELRALQRESESDLRARLASLLKEDFGQEMAEMLGLESLADRDEAWRRLSHYPARGPALEIDNSTTSTDAPPLTTRPRQGTARFAAVDNSNAAIRPSRGTGALRRVQHESARILAVPPPPPPTSHRPPPTPTYAQRTPALPEQTQRVSHGRSAPGFVGGIIFAGALVIATAFALRHETPANATTVQPAIRVAVTDSQKETPEESTPQALDPFGETASSDSDADVQAVDTGADEAVLPPHERHERNPSGQPDPKSLTRAFRKEQGKIESCFSVHAVEVEGLPQMQLEFDLEASGKLAGVHVTPSALAKTPLGKCLEKVASGTKFPPQSRPVSFAIPLTASRTGPR